MRRTTIPGQVTREVKSAVGAWQAERNLSIFSSETIDAWLAIATLSSKGCAAADIVNVLELLRRYCLDEPFGSVGRQREQWIDRAKNLVLRLRRDANNAEELLGFAAGRSQSQPRTNPQPRSPSTDIDSDDDSSPQSRPPASEIQSEDIRLLEIDQALWEQPEIWEEIRSWADDLEAYVRIQEDKELPLAQPFLRKRGGSLGLLVSAAILIEDATGQPHYPEIASLLRTICPGKALSKKKGKPVSENTIYRKISRFKKRNQEYVDEFLKPNQIRGYLRRSPRI
jgi:hypothetical protein